MARFFPFALFRRRSVRAFSVLVLWGCLVGFLLAWWINANFMVSLPPLDGERVVEGLSAPVTIERDALGIPTLTAASRTDLAFATGFVHGQDRFFQMDILRRHPAGELSALFGRAALEEDKRSRVHRFRHRVRQRLSLGSSAERETLQAYAVGVEAGRASLGAPPWEYSVLGVKPEAWKEEDTWLVVLGMYRTLQESGIQRENTQGVVEDLLPPALVRFLTPSGSPFDAPLQGPAYPSAPLPTVKEIDLRTDPARWTSTGAQSNVRRLPSGSNNWAVAGSRTTDGRAMVANDMHLGLMVPGIWYRASFCLTGAAGTRRVTGITLPGAPAMIVGSNGTLAWGFTNSEGDFTDLIALETDPNNPTRYRTPEGWREIERQTETIDIAGGKPEEIVVEETIWGPIYDSDHRGKRRALRWLAHLPEALNLDLMKMETAATLEEALALAPTTGTPAQNLVVADSKGGIAWTIIGRLPRRVGFDGSRPTSWADGSRKWDGLVPASDYPRIVNPPEGILWTANNRVATEPWANRIGKNNYDFGARAKQIRDDLRARDTMSEADMLAIQLDDRALFLERWQRLLLATLAPQSNDPELEPLRRAVMAWTGRAEPASVGYRLIRRYRQLVRERIFGSLLAPCTRADPRVHPAWLDSNVEESIWRLVTDRPTHLLPPNYTSWNALLLDCAAALGAEARNAKNPPATGLAAYSWGAINRARLRHPLSGGLGPLADWLRLNMPADPMHGDTQGIPRIVGPSEGASQRMAVSPGREEQGYFHMPAGQNGHPRSPHYRDGHAAWVRGEATPFLPGETIHRIELSPKR